MTDAKCELLRHTVATLAYRGGKTLRNAPEAFAGFQVSPKTRTPGQILAHISDLLDWALSLAKGKQEWHDSAPLPWNHEVERFFTALRAFDDYLASEDPLGISAEKLFSRPHRRCPDTHRTDRDDSPPGRFPSEGRELSSC